MTVGRRVVVQLAGVLAGQDQALRNARRASTEVSRRRVERDEVAIYLDALDEPSAGARGADDRGTGRDGGAAGATADRAR
jgi:hypothetical protein